MTAPDLVHIHCALYCSGQRARELKKPEIDKMPCLNVIDPAKSEHAYLMVFEQNEYGLLQFLIDSRILDAAAVKNAYPIPGMDECSDFLKEACMFIILDSASGYWKLEINEETFTSHHRLYRFLKMLFCLKNDSIPFQKAMDIILSTVQ